MYDLPPRVVYQKENAGKMLVLSSFKEPFICYYYLRISFHFSHRQSSWPGTSSSSVSFNEVTCVIKLGIRM